MNTLSQLPAPLNTFVVDIPKNQYYDFELEEGSTYPLSGVTYPVDYGNIPGHTGEDGHELDLFVGSDIGGKAGSVFVYRGTDVPNEHKFYVAMSDSELATVLQELEPVLLDHASIATSTELLEQIENFKDKQ